MKPVNFSQYKQIQKMSLNDLNRWVIEIYKAGVQEGVVMQNDNLAAEVTEDRLFDIILSVKGIGRARAEEAVRRILAEGTYGTEVR